MKLFKNCGLGRRSGKASQLKMKLGRLLTCALVILLASLKVVAAKEFLRVCYFASWANVRPSSLARYDIKDIDPQLCTHLIYAFAKIDTTNKRLVATNPSLEDDRPGVSGRYTAFNNLKNLNSRLRTLISLGGQNDNSEGFLTVTENGSNLAIFANSVVEFLRKRNFDGLDIDWEFPRKETGGNFTSLLKALRQAFNKEPESNRLLLTIAGPAGKWYVDDGYDVPQIASYVDYVNLMTYDYTVKTSRVTAFNSPLYSRKDIRFNEALSVNYTVHYWRDKGLSFSKMLVGVTGVGRRLVLQNTTLTEVGSPVTGEVRKGDLYEIEAGLAYPEICDFILDERTKKYFDDEQKCSYLVLGDDWVGYEDKKSITIKIEWMVQQGFAGFMFWSLDQDDFSGAICEDGKYPLLSTVNKILALEGQPSTTSVPKPVETTLSISSSTESGSEATGMGCAAAMAVSLSLSYICFSINV